MMPSTVVNWFLCRQGNLVSVRVAKFGRLFHHTLRAQFGREGIVVLLQGLKLMRS